MWIPDYQSSKKLSLIFSKLWVISFSWKVQSCMALFCTLLDQFVGSLIMITCFKYSNSTVFAHLRFNKEIEGWIQRIGDGYFVLNPIRFYFGCDDVVCQF